MRNTKIKRSPFLPKNLKKGQEIVYHIWATRTLWSSLASRSRNSPHRSRRASKKLRRLAWTIDKEILARNMTKNVFHRSTIQTSCRPNWWRASPSFLWVLLVHFGKQTYILCTTKRKIWSSTLKVRDLSWTMSTKSMKHRRKSSFLPPKIRSQRLRAHRNLSQDSHLKNWRVKRYQWVRKMMSFQTRSWVKESSVWEA